MGTLKGVGRVYQQTFIDTYAKVGFAKLYDGKTPITAADLLNDRVSPFYEENGVALQRTDSISPSRISTADLDGWDDDFFLHDLGFAQRTVSNRCRGGSSLS